MARSACLNASRAWRLKNTSYRRNLESLYVDGRGLSLLWVALFVKRYLLPFIQAAQTSTLDGAYVNENVGATTVRLNKPETLCRVEPLHGAVRHLSLQL